MNDRLKWRMWSTHAGRYFDENNDAMLENVFECMKQQICYDCQNPVLRKIYDRIAYNHIEDGMVFEQCTGLKDKNGKLIYEGDILDFDLSTPRNGGHYRGFIRWEEYNEIIGWVISDMDMVGEWDLRQIAHPNDWMVWGEVIGNIHKNADLLENEE